MILLGCLWYLFRIKTKSSCYFILVIPPPTWLPPVFSLTR